MKKLTIFLFLVFGLGGAVFANFADVIKAKCDSGNGEACAFFGMLYDENEEEGVEEEDVLQIMKYYCYKSSTLDDNFCDNFFLYAKEKGILKDYFKAKKYYQKSCDLDVGLGCAGLGGLYFEGYGVRQDYSKAKKYLHKACDLNDGLGCAGLGFMHYEGEGVLRSYSEAKKYFQKACDLNDGLGCAFLGVLYYEGQSVEENTKTAKELFGKACDLHIQLGCDIYRKLNEAEESFDLFEWFSQ